MKILIFIYDIFKKFPRLLSANILSMVLGSMFEVCSLLAVAPLIDIFMNPDLQHVSSLTRRVLGAMETVGLPASLESCISIFLGFIVLSASFQVFTRHSVFKTKYAFLRDITLGTFEDFFRAKWYFFSANKQGTLLNTFIRELSIVGNAFGAITLLFTGSIQLIFYLAIPFYISWQVTLISLVIAFLFIWPFALLGKISYRLGTITTSTGNEIGSVIQESFGLAKIVLGFGNQKKGSENLKLAFDAHSKAAVKSQTLSFAIPVLYQPFGFVVLVVALVVAKKLGVGVPEMAVLLLALLRAASSIGRLASCKNSLENFFPSYEQVKGLRSRALEFRQPSGDKIFTGFNKEIMVENLSFAYPNHKLVLKDINMKIPKGRMIAIVGESGAGKSTLVDIIMGFYEPLNGKVLFDDIDLVGFDINSYRKRIGYVPQDTVLFNMSIKDNLVWAKEDASIQEIKYACRQAYADEFIESFPNGYGTLVGDRGVRLSGGQRQRIALARAILREPELLFLDEATSSLDTKSERLIQQAIEKIAKKTTIIVIAHRLSTIVNADYVYVLKNGQVAEEGIYSDLTRRDGHFNQMVKLQLLELSK